ncbi:MAG: methyltransferase domain-containing protein [Pseudomonadales bacterium]|nr:methyltransferase domain-containing protein [Pseudomonadales bacterium]
MIDYAKPKKIHAFDAKFDAQKIAFAPVAFQAARCLIKFDILKHIDASGETGINLQALVEACSISEYGIHVLVDMGLSMNLIYQEEGQYILDKTGYFLLHDAMAQRNLNFVHDVCYEGLFKLDESIENGKPEGLQVFGDWPTIYPGLKDLPEAAKKSWFEFDHYYSDHAFPQTLPLIFEFAPKHILDVGGNTGKWALKCTEFDDDVKITIMDLPGQLAEAQKNAEKAGVAERIQGFEINLLDENQGFYQGADTIWMSQFLDCFSKEEILSILKRAAKVMDKNTRLYILETFWDRQPFEAGAYCVNATSLYFTTMANGNSRMYHSKDMIKLVQEAGLYVEQDTDNIGLGHTLLNCRLKPSD